MQPTDRLALFQTGMYTVTVTLLTQSAKLICCKGPGCMPGHREFVRTPCATNAQRMLKIKLLYCCKECQEH